MKLSKRMLIVLAVGAFIIVFAVLGMTCSQRVNEQDELNEQLSLAQLRLKGVQPEQLSSQQAELEGQLSQATSQFEAVKDILSQPIGSITISSILFEIAEAHGLEVTEVTSPGPDSESLEGVTCSVISLTAKVEGDVHNLVSFVAKLNSHFTTGVVKSVEINIPETTDEGEGEGEEEEQEKEKASADIQLVVYTHQGG